MPISVNRIFTAVGPAQNRLRFRALIFYTISLYFNRQPEDQVPAPGALFLSGFIIIPRSFLQSGNASADGVVEPVTAEQHGLAPKYTRDIHFFFTAEKLEKLSHRRVVLRNTKDKIQAQLFPEVAGICVNLFIFP